FNHFKIHKTEKYLEFSTNPDLKFVLNDITRNFTKFELKELTNNLKSSYSKTMFRLLKQYKHTGYLKLSIVGIRLFGMLISLGIFNFSIVKIINTFTLIIF
ncbi:RepB family plasmid replication initiator protein, partial [Staphylococcus capitis]|nr:RepB family plasmid replication initiator protein [Staphylococcus capitis]